MFVRVRGRATAARSKMANETGSCLGVLPALEPGADKVDSGESEQKAIEAAEAVPVAGPGRQNET